MSLPFLNVAVALASSVAVLATTSSPAMLAGSAAAPAASSVNAAPTVSAKRSAPQLRVASYNIRNVNSYQGIKNEKKWQDRRGAVAETILGQDPDVLAVQEATQGVLHDKRSAGKNLSQYDDLLALLGNPWRITNAVRYNCVKDTSPNHCTYEYKGASEGQRIFYNSDRVELLAQGSRKLSVPKGKGDNYMDWAEFRQISTGKSFLFSNLHTVGTAKNYKVKTTQAKQSLAELKKHNPGGLPMIAVGDWNSSRFERPSNGPYDVYRKAGLADPLGGAYRTHKPKGAFVGHTIRTWLSSSNGGWSRKAPAHKSWGFGSYIDYIMVTKMAVPEWETVAHLDSRGRFVGTIPSDHNMIRASVVLP